MNADCVTDRKIKQLNELAMKYETAVTCLPAEDYLQAFYDFYEIRNRELQLVLSPDSFHETLKEVCGDDVWQPIAEKAESLFGDPARIAVFEDDDAGWKVLQEELEGPDGLGPFFFIFDIMFCEYEGFTLCFISGTNN